MSDEETLFPLEVVLRGTPVSLQTSNTKRKEAWKNQVAEAACKRRYDTSEQVLLDLRPLAVKIYYFPKELMEGDIDNIVKLIVDALIGVAYLNDRVVERVIVQKFEPKIDWAILAPSDQLALALETEPPVVYICVDDDLGWRRA